MVGFGLSVFCVPTPTGRAAEAFDSQLAVITDKIAEAVTKENLKAVTVAGFTDLHDKETDLGLFLADQVSAGLVQCFSGAAPDRGIPLRLAGLRERVSAFRP